MYNLLISFSASAVLGVLLTYLTGYYQWGLFGGLALFFGLNYYLSKRIMKVFEKLMNDVGKDLSNQRFDKAIRRLKGAYRLARWQFFMESQLNSQVGTIYYLMQEFDNAFGYLQKGFNKHWVGMGMLAVLYMKKDDKENMVKTFEKAVKSSPKEGLLWSVYAYCMLKGGDREKAQEILSRGMAKIPDDDRLKANHSAIANKQRMKMKAYGEQWMQFYLEKTPYAGQKVPRYMQALAQSQGGKRRVIRR